MVKIVLIISTYLLLKNNSNWMLIKSGRYKTLDFYKVKSFYYILFCS